MRKDQLCLEVYNLPLGYHDPHDHFRVQGLGNSMITVFPPFVGNGSCILSSKGTALQSSNSVHQQGHSQTCIKERYTTEHMHNYSCSPTN